jgi:thiamine-phosphate pyrophosphorylase
MVALSTAAPRPRLVGLYALTPDIADTATLSARTSAVLSGGASAVQYRNKSAPSALRREQAETLRALCRERGAIFIVNDDVELALAAGADGVHVGRDDASVASARDRLGPAAIVGVSCYDAIDRAENALAHGADYIAFGSFYSSPVKPDAARAPLRLLSESKVRWPGISVVAIGGITPANAQALVAAGADAVAVISALYDAPDVRLAARALVECFR